MNIYFQRIVFGSWSTYTEQVEVIALVGRWPVHTLAKTPASITSIAQLSEKCNDSASVMTWLLPSKRYLIYCSPVTLRQTLHNSAVTPNPEIRSAKWCYAILVPHCVPFWYTWPPDQDTPLTQFTVLTASENNELHGPEFCLTS
jgi:hypothetical protein